MKGDIIENKVIVSDNRSISKLYGKRGYGSIQDRNLHLSLIEAYYLFEKEKLEIYENGQKLTLEALLAKGKEETDFSMKYIVYKDLRDRGYIVKTGFKYGCHFRVYRNSIEDHAQYLVHSLAEQGSITTNELIRHARLAHSVKKRMVFALVDEENDISYFSIDRLKI